MSNVVHIQPITDAAIETAINVLQTVDVAALPEHVRAALQQLAVKILRETI
jgi:hypothetical protein